MSQVVDSHLGRRLRHRRWMIGMTQAELAEQLGIRFQQVQKYESGANRIAASRLWDMAQALDVPITYFFDGLDTVPSDNLAAEDLSEARMMMTFYGNMDSQEQRKLRTLTQGEDAAGAGARRRS